MNGLNVPEPGEKEDDVRLDDNCSLESADEDGSSKNGDSAQKDDVSKKVS